MFLSSMTSRLHCRFCFSFFFEFSAEVGH
jgi:hypothetical protein